jgi:hypothetical protein
MKEMRSNAHNGAGRQRHRSHAAEQDDHVGKHASGGITATQRIRPEYLHLYRHPTSASLSLAEYYRLQELTEHNEVYNFGVMLLDVIEFVVPAVEIDNITGILDDRVPLPRGHEVEAVARVAKIPTECVRPPAWLRQAHHVRGRRRAGVGRDALQGVRCRHNRWLQNSSWHAGSNMEMASRSHTRSKMATIVDS